MWLWNRLKNKSGTHWSRTGPWSNILMDKMSTGRAPLVETDAVL